MSSSILPIDTWGIVCEFLPHIFVIHLRLVDSHLNKSVIKYLQEISYKRHRFEVFKGQYLTRTGNLRFTNNIFTSCISRYLNSINLTEERTNAIGQSIPFQNQILVCDCQYSKMVLEVFQFSLRHLFFLPTHDVELSTFEQICLHNNHSITTLGMFNTPTNIEFLNVFLSTTQRQQKLNCLIIQSIEFTLYNHSPPVYVIQNIKAWNSNTLANIRMLHLDFKACDSSETFFEIISRCPLLDVFSTRITDYDEERLVEYAVPEYWIQGRLRFIIHILYPGNPSMITSIGLHTQGRGLWLKKLHDANVCLWKLFIDGIDCMTSIHLPITTCLNLKWFHYYGKSIRSYDFSTSKLYCVKTLELRLNILNQWDTVIELLSRMPIIEHVEIQHATLINESDEVLYDDIPEDMETHIIKQKITCPCFRYLCVKRIPRNSIIFFALKGLLFDTRNERKQKCLVVFDYDEVVEGRDRACFLW